MKNISIILLIFISLLPLIISLKVSQIGRNDWHLQNIGQISYLQLTQFNKIFFLSSKNLLGYLNGETGQIQSRIMLNQQQTLINRNQEEVIFITYHNQIVKYRITNLEKIINNRFVGDKILKSIKSLINTNDDMIILNDDKNIRAYKALNNQKQEDNTYTTIYTAEPEQILLKLFKFNNKLYIALTKNNQLIFREIIGNKMLNQKIIKSNFQTDHLSEWIEKWSIENVLQNSNKLILLFKNKQNSQIYETIILNSDFKVLFQYSDKFNQIIDDKLQFINSQTAYDLKKQSIIYEKLKEYPLSIYKILKYQTDQSASINSYYIFQKSSYKQNIIIQFTDLSIKSYLTESSNVNLLWKRQQGLAYIDKVLFMKYPFSDHLDNQYHRNLFTDAYKQMSLAQKLIKVPGNIVLRISEQIKDLISLIKRSVISIFQFKDLNWEKISKFTMSEQQQIKLGLKKYIIAINSRGLTYSIDTKTSGIRWKKQTQYNKQNIISLIRLRKDYETQSAILITYSSISNLVTFSQITQDGIINRLQTFESATKPSVHKLNPDSVILMIGDKTLKFQLGANVQHQKHFYFYTLEDRKITGWKQQNQTVLQIWNVHLDQGQKVLATAGAYNDEHRSHIPLLDNGKVIYKNVDFTNLAILTSKNSTSLSLYIINGMTGQVQFNEYRSGLNLNHPVNLVYDQNNVIVTYYNNRNKLYQIWTVEQYQEKIQTSAIRMITEYLQGQEYKPSRNRENIIFLSQVYASPVTIKKLYISNSKESLIRRNLIIITRDDKIYMIGRQLISTRRPKQTALFKNQAYPPYQYLLPLQLNKFFSYNIQLYDLQNIHFSSSDMESTIFVLAYGIDVFMIRIAPDMPFDTITEDFNYVVLVIIMLAVTIGVLVLREKARKAKLTKKHRD